MQVKGAALSALRLLAPKLANLPQAIWKSAMFGSVEPVAGSVLIAFAAPPSTGTGTCTGANCTCGGSGEDRGGRRMQLAFEIDIPCAHEPAAQQASVNASD